MLALGALGVPVALAEPSGEEDDTVAFSCSSVTFTFAHFPAAKGNTVTERVQLDGKQLAGANFSFDGPAGANSLSVSLPPGHHSMDAYATWDTNGLKGGHDRKLAGGITCAGSPSFAIQMLQRIAGGGGSFAPAPLGGEAGQTIDYAIVLTNTGNVALSFTTFSDPGCDAGTITGGPGLTPVPPGGSTTFYCHHLLTVADQKTGLHQNVVSVTATSPEGGVSVSTHTSNTVVVTLTPPPPPPPAPETPSRAPHTPAPLPSPPATALVRAQAAVALFPALIASASPRSRSGRLGSFAAVPALNGPEGCVRGSVTASVNAAGVRAVTFSLDGRRARALRAGDARGGRLSVTVAVTGLALGPHRLLAKITMAGAGPRLSATRARTFLRCDPATVTPTFTG